MSTIGTLVRFAEGSLAGRTGVWGRDATGRPYVRMSNGSRTYNPGAVIAVADEAADDALLDALGGRDAQPAAEVTAEALAADELNALLLAWRRSVDHPAGDLVSARLACRTIRRARYSRLWTRITRTLTRSTR